MGARRRVRATLRAALTLAAVLAVSSCGGGGTRTPAPPADSPPPPGVTRVTGVERLVWDQAGELAGLTFRAYVGNNPVELGATTCDFVDGVVACSSPLTSRGSPRYSTASSATGSAMPPSPPSSSRSRERPAPESDTASGLLHDGVFPSAGRDRAGARPGGLRRVHRAGRGRTGLDHSRRRCVAGRRARARSAVGAAAAGRRRAQPAGRKRAPSRHRAQGTLTGAMGRTL